MLYLLLIVGLCIFNLTRHWNFLWLTLMFTSTYGSNHFRLIAQRKSKLNNLLFQPGNTQPIRKTSWKWNRSLIKRGFECKRSETKQTLSQLLRVRECVCLCASRWWHPHTARRYPHRPFPKSAYLNLHRRQQSGRGQSYDSVEDERRPKYNT